MGVIYLPVSEELYYASKGNRAFNNVFLAPDNHSQDIVDTKSHILDICLFIGTQTYCNVSQFNDKIVL